MAASESTPLLPPKDDATSAVSPSLFSPWARLLLTNLLISVAFSATSTPLLWQMKVMSCEILAPPAGDCSGQEVESAAARAISFMVTLTTISGTLNLFSTGWLQRRYGPRLAMVVQTAVPCIRNLCQRWAVINGGIAGVRVLQWTQLLTIFGGGAGYLLTSNAFANALVEQEERTAAFGVLQGVFMLGTAIGFTAGGLLGDVSVSAPFELAFTLLILSTFMSSLFLPFVPPSEDSKTGGAGIGSIFKPLLVLGPRRIEREDGGTGKRYWGVTLLAFGTGMGVFATAYVPLMLQMIATNEFGFRTKLNGFAMSTTSISRALFLTLAFPRIIKRGRQYFTKPSASPPSSPAEPATLDDNPIPTAPDMFEPATAIPETQEPTPVPKPTDVAHGSHFDLAFLRGSLVLDALLTAGASLMSEGRHVYVAAAILPLASGTAAAAKGLLVELVPPAQQAEALAGIALVETIAMTLTVSGFGYVFAYLSEIGRPFLVFDLNALVALTASFILFFVRFPRASAPSSGV